MKVMLIIYVLQVISSNVVEEVVKVVVWEVSREAVPRRISSVRVTIVRTPVEDKTGAGKEISSIESNLIKFQY